MMTSQHLLMRLRMGKTMCLQINGFRSATTLPRSQRRAAGRTNSGGAVWLFAGLLWLLIGAVIGGAVHDIVVLFASMRKNGKSLSEVAKDELGPVAGFCTGLSMLFIITITMAGLSMVVLHALERNPWGTFAVGITIPIAMGVGLFYKKTGNLKLASTVGFLFLMAGVFIGPWVQTTALGDFLTLDTKTLAIALPVYAFLLLRFPFGCFLLRVII